MSCGWTISISYSISNLKCKSSQWILSVISKKNAFKFYFIYIWIINVHILHSIGADKWHLMSLALVRTIYWMYNYLFTSNMNRNLQCQLKKLIIENIPILSYKFSLHHPIRITNRNTFLEHTIFDLDAGLRYQIYTLVCKYAM